MAIPEIHIHIHDGADEDRVAELEERVLSAETDLIALTVKVTEFNEDIAAKVAALEAAQGEFTPAGRLAFDALSGAIATGVASVGDADADGNPATPTPEPQPGI